MLRRNFFIFICLIVSLFAFIPARASQIEEIVKWKTQIEINRDSSLIVKEEIIYDFGKNRRHGIYRDIPVKYQTSRGRRSIDLSVLAIRRDGVPENYSVRRRGNNIRIKIGDANRTITGKHTYILTYEVKRALNYFDSYDELYWNVTGDGWLVPIKQAQAEIILPAMIKEENLQFSCYQGRFGSQDKCMIRPKQNGVIWAGARGMLQAGEGMTVAVSFPKGLVVEPSWLERLGLVVKDNLILFLPVIVLLVMFYLWYRYGRDPRGRETIIAEYEPPAGLTPILTGSLVDERVDSRDLTAGIVYLAQQGFLTIKRQKQGKWFKQVDYQLTLTKDLDRLPEIAEKDLIRSIFGNKVKAGQMIAVSDLKYDRSFAKEIKKIKKKVYQQMVKRGFFARNPLRVRNVFVTGGMFIMSLSFVFVVFNEMFTWSFFASGLIILFFGFFMPRKTKYGVMLKEKILGFKEFLSVTDKERFKFHNTPSKSPQQFMEYLPYAIALGVEKEWAEQFAEMYMDPPKWYQGDFAKVFVAQQLVEELQGFSSKFNGVMAASGGSGSSGGGFSGGGFGGGGGGSW